MKTPIRRLAFATALSIAAMAAPAQAASVSMTAGVATFTAGPGIDNNLEIKPHPSAVLFEDDSELVHPGPDCEAVSPHAVKCGTYGLTSVRALMSSGDNDVVVSADVRTVIDGQGGDENRFWGGPNTDVMIGGDRADRFSGGDGSDDLNGGDGDDRLLGGAANDELNGQGDNDNLIGDGGADRFDGGTGHDIADYSGRGGRVVISIDDVANDGAVVPVIGSEGDDVRSTNEVVLSGHGDDELTGSDQPESLFGGPGNDVIRGGVGPDGMLGEDGIDTVSYSDHTVPVRVTLDNASDDGVQDQFDGINGFENVEGGTGDDTLVGDAGANVLRGGDGNDTVEGLGGQDSLIGADGDDTIRSEDGEADSDDCGSGTDTAFADAADTKVDCELPVAEKPADPPPSDPAPVDPPPSDPPVRPALAVTPKKPRADRRGYVRVKLSCSAGSTERCAGKLRFRRGARTYATRKYSIASGSAKTVRVRVKRSLRRTLGRKRLKVAVG